MKINFIDNISLLRLAGITKFISIDVHSGYVKFAIIRRKEPFYIICNRDLLPKLEIIGIEYKEATNLGTLIGNILNDLVVKYNLKSAALIFGLNDFKFSNVSIPADIEDIDFWFSENKNKFLPEGLSTEDFTFTYEFSDLEIKVVYSPNSRINKFFLSWHISCLLSGPMSKFVKL